MSDDEIEVLNEILTTVTLIAERLTRLAELLERIAVGLGVEVMPNVLRK